MNSESRNQEAHSVVVGLGHTGLSCARFLHSQQRRFTVVDSREAPPGLNELRQLDASIPVELGAFNEHTLLAANELIVSPGVSLKTEALAKAKEAGVKVSGDISLFSQTVSAPILAVTGSNGKSTVVAMIAAILQKAGQDYGMGGNLDGDYFKPALELLSENSKAIYVLELSSFQLETTDSLDAEVAVLLNVSEDHMDRYDSMEEYQLAKQRIFNGCKKAVVNGDLFSLDDLSALGINSASTKVISFGLAENVSEGFCLHQGKQGEQGKQETKKYLAYQTAGETKKLMPIADMKIVGSHNVSNALAAAAATSAAGISEKVICTALKAFPGLPHRCQFVKEVNGVSYYNDSKATNVAAALASLRGFTDGGLGKVFWIVGGSSKNADFSPMVETVREVEARNAKSVGIAAVLLIGEAAAELETLFSGVTSTVLRCVGLEDAVRRAAAIAQPDDTVLLAPACASFDMFENYQQRGNAFVAAVEALK